MNKDQQNLRQFQATSSEASFRRILDSNIGFVLSVAQRVLQNSDLAQDVAQEVFTRLASHPEKVPESLPLSVWLHRSTRSIAIDLVRAEQRRRHREQTALEVNHMNQPEADWSQVSPMIDQALDELRKEDRIAVVLRFFKAQSHAQIGDALGIGSDAARMRVNRALETLRLSLKKKGVAISAVTLATSLPVNASVAVPRELVTSMTATALASSSSTTTATTLGACLFTTTLMNTKTIAATACVALLGLSTWQRYEISNRQQDLAKARTGEIDGRFGPQKSQSKETNLRRTTPTQQLLSEARRLAALEPTIVREAALQNWMKQLKTTEDIQALRAALQEDQALGIRLRTRLACALAGHWAIIDFDGAMDAHFLSALNFEASPFGEILLNQGVDQHPLGIIAETDPERFSARLTEDPQLILDLYTGKRESQLITRAASEAGQQQLTESSPVTLGCEGALAEVLIRHAPMELFETLANVSKENQPKAPFNTFALGVAMAEKAPLDEVWARLSKTPFTQIGYHEGIIKGVLANDNRPSRIILDEIKSNPEDSFVPQRLVALGESLVQQKDKLSDAIPEITDQWWNDLNEYAALVNAQGGQGFAEGGVLPPFRSLALMTATEDLDASLAWADQEAGTLQKLKLKSEVIMKSLGIPNAQLRPLGGQGSTKFQLIGSNKTDPDQSVDGGIVLELATKTSNEDMVLNLSEQLKALDPATLNALQNPPKVSNQIQRRNTPWSGSAKVIGQRF